MAMHSCPHCNKDGITTLRRAFLGPAMVTICTECGGKVGVPLGRSIVAAVPYLLAIGAASVIDDPVNSVFCLVIGAAVMFGLFFKFVPLIKK